MSDLFRKEYNSIHKLHEYEKETKIIAENLVEKYSAINSREMSLAITNLEQSIMWFTKGLYAFKGENE